MIISEQYFTMSDGIRLYTRIVLPEDNKKFPIVFMRTPYEEARKGEPFPAEKYDDDLFLKNGYGVILQHTRGCGDSEGECKPYEERQDGLDTLAIIRTLPFYNGEIYVTGGSYPATVHLCYLETNPHDIKGAALSIQTDRMYFRNYRNGCCYDFCNMYWWTKMLRRRYPNQAPYKEAITRPYYKIPERLFGEDVPECTQMLLNDEYNDFWIKGENTNASARLKIPTLFTDGWYDFYIDGMFSMWDRLPEETKKHSVFVVGPWGHATKTNDKAEYPLPNGNVPDDYAVSFFNSIRDKKPYTEFETGKLHYYSIGGDYWTAEREVARRLRLYFNNDNTLSKEMTVKGEQSYTYDPDKPLGFFKHFNIYKAQATDGVEGVLSFISSPFEEETHIFGRIECSLKVKTDCEDTAFYVRVYMVEDGEAYNLTDAITSLSYQNKDHTPGKECTISISTFPIAFTLKKGCSVRVDISSHSDLYVPHSNTKGHWAKVTETRVAKNTVICDEDSCITLPISL